MVAMTQDVWTTEEKFFGRAGNFNRGSGTHEILLHPRAFRVYVVNCTHAGADVTMRFTDSTTLYGGEWLIVANRGSSLASIKVDSFAGAELVNPLLSSWGAKFYYCPQTDDWVWDEHTHELS
jgi:hypothetical protein